MPSRDNASASAAGADSASAAGADSDATASAAGADSASAAGADSDSASAAGADSEASRTNAADTRTARATARADARSVIAANQAFYEAFARGDLAELEALWASTAPVACIHPGWAALHGREEVMESWRSILGGGSATSVRCTRPSASVLGDSAYVVCGESIQGAELVATNFFVREDGAWKLVHHHAGPVHRRAERPRVRSGTLN